MAGTNKKNGQPNPKGGSDGDDKVYQKYLNSSEVPDDQVIDSIFLERRTVHANDAIDYEDIDELADEDDLPEETEAMNVVGDDDFNNILGEADEYDDDKLQAEANDEFDDMFGDDNGDMSNFQHNNDVGNNDLFNDLNHDHQFDDDDGLKDLNMGEIFDDTNDHRPQRKQKIILDEERILKKQKLQGIVKSLEAKRIQRNIAYHYPGYSIEQPFNFHLFFLPKPKYFRPLRPPIAFKTNIKPLVPTKLTLEVDVDQRKAFKSGKMTSSRLNSKSANSKIIKISQADLDFIKDVEFKGTQTDTFLKQISFLNNDWSDNDKFAEFTKDLILSTTDWNDEAIINAGDSKYAPKKFNIENSTLDILLDDYDDENIFNGQISENVLRLDMNDPNLLFVPQKMKNATKAVIPTTEKLLELKFNFSNDKEYEVLKKNYNTKVRSQLSNLNIEHALPAIRLQSPYYKVKLNKDEARSYHRPRFVVRPGALISFSKLKQRKKKKDRGKSLQEIFSRTVDLTSADTAPLIGMEYSEEYPQILSNFGMGSKLINYYRKEREDDSSRPKTQIGETHVLGVEDRSPFWNFGEVAPGDFVPTLYNNMVRAPIFKHEPKNTDFLLMRSQGCGNHPRYYLRNINFMFAVGNTFPAVEVPAPHSRKVTNTFKNRLKMVVFRVMNNKGIARVSVKDVSKHFPDQNDMQNRQRLKEFMEYQRQGDDQGFWKIKNSDIVPTEDDIRTMITPEDASLLDSMQHGQQALDDTNVLFGDESKKDEKKEEAKKEREKKDKKEDGTDKNSENKDDKSEPVKKEKEKDKEPKEKVRKPRDPDAEIDIDEELAPWNLSRNFMNANQTKTMLQLNGEGDPTGIGLGFSLLRSTQKNGFHPLFAPPIENVPKNNTAAYQQKLYEIEVNRIWYSQRSSLVDHGSEFNLQTIYDEYKPVSHEKYIKKKIKESDKTDLESKFLRITRRVRDENGIVHRKVETITDSRIIKAYILRKKRIEDDMLKNAEVEDILPTNDKELNKIRRKALEEKLANLEKRAKQSKAKKPAKDSIHAAAAAGGKIIDANTVMLPDGSYAFGGKGIGKGKSTTRRCKSCGAFGHIRTNKTCPLYYQTNGGTAPVKKRDASASVSVAPESVGVSSSPTAPPSAPPSAP